MDRTKLIYELMFSFCCTGILILLITRAYVVSVVLVIASVLLEAIRRYRLGFGVSMAFVLHMEVLS
jgi:ABC-type siderophore export system fused ATPase/permease subunit